MLTLDVCLESVFVNLPYEERIRRIAQAGYKSVEFWFHDATFDGATCATSQPKDAKVLRDVCAEAGVTVNNMVVNAPDGSFGGAIVRADELNRYLERVEEVIEYAAVFGCTRAITCTGNEQPDLSREQMYENVQNALTRAAAIAAKKNFTLVLEPLNVHVDHPGYFLGSSLIGADMIRAINNPSLRLLYDVYHMQIMEGNVVANIEKNIGVIGHFHSAAVPGRGEHFAGELDYPFILQKIEQLGYKGAFGLEYFPKMEDNLVSLKKVRAYLEGVRD